MPAALSKRRRKRARRKRNREREAERRANRWPSLPMRKHIVLTFRGGAKLEYELGDAITLPWDGATQASRHDVLRRLWEDADHEVEGDEQ